MVWLSVALIADLAVGQAGAPLPPRMQAALFKKLLALDPALERPDSGPALLIATKDPKSAGVRALIEAFAAEKISAEAVAPAVAQVRLAAAKVIYIASDVDPASLEAACIEHGALSIAGTPAFAERGAVAIAVGVGRVGKPEIIVHAIRLRRENHMLPAFVMELARVIR